MKPIVLLESNRFHDGYGTGYCSEENHQEEHNTNDNTGGTHAFKYLWQGNELLFAHAIKVQHNFIVGLYVI